MSTDIRMKSERRPDIRFLMTHIMNRDQIKTLLAHRKSFFSKVRNEDVTGADCLEMIKLQSHLLDTCLIKIDELSTAKTNNIDNKVIKTICLHIHHLYMILFKFPTDIKTLTAYINFSTVYDEYKIKATHKVLKRILKSNTNNVIIWKKILTYYLEEDFYGIAIDIYHDGLTLMKDNSQEFWNIIIKHLNSIGDQNVVENMYIQGTKHRDIKVMFTFMIGYLKWCQRIKGVTAKNDLSNRFRSQSPQWAQILCLYSIYKEWLKPIPNEIFIDKMYNDFLTEFNHEDIELFTEEVNIKASLFLTPELMIPFIQRLHIIHEKHIMSKSSSINEITT